MTNAERELLRTIIRLYRELDSWISEGDLETGATDRQRTFLDAELGRGVSASTLASVTGSDGRELAPLLQNLETEGMVTVSAAPDWAEDASPLYRPAAEAFELLGLDPDAPPNGLSVLEEVLPRGLSAA